MTAGTQPAFPGVLDHGQGQLETWTGMTLRQYYVGQALTGLCSQMANIAQGLQVLGRESEVPRIVALLAVEIAELALKEEAGP